MANRIRERAKKHRPALSKQEVKLSKKLSWILRHGAEEQELYMDEAGWVDADELCEKLQLGADQLEHLIQHNTKRRIERRGSQVRACQGHSLDNGWVRREALEASWDTESELAHMWHGTQIAALPGIVERGIVSVNRTHVHCADGLSSQVGKRSQVAVMLRINLERLRALGFVTYRSSNGVLLVREVPFAAIDGFCTMTRRSREQADELAEQLSRPHLVGPDLRLEQRP